MQQRFQKYEELLNSMRQLQEQKDQIKQKIRQQIEAFNQSYSADKPLELQKQQSKNFLMRAQPQGQQEKDIIKFQNQLSSKQTAFSYYQQILDAFQIKLKEQFLKCKQKYKQIDALDIFLTIRKKKLLYELIYIFFQPILFQALQSIQFMKISEKLESITTYISVLGKDEEINAALGLIVLFQNLLCKYLNIIPRHQATFMGSRSFILQPKSETKLDLSYRPIKYNLFLKSTEKANLDAGIKYVFGNFFQILSSLRIDKKYKVYNFDQLLEVIFNYIYYGEV